MNILFTCGGSAGHINPAVALARLFQERKPDCHILFVGAKGGIEERLVAKEGFSLQTVSISPFYRSLSLSGIRSNLRTLGNLRRSKREAASIVATFRPDLVVGTGGFASYPVVREAAKRGIPTAIHESNAIPGLTTRRLAAHVDCVLVGLPGCEGQYPHPERVVLCGTPVRGDFFAQTRREAKEALGFSKNSLLVLSYWGSLGAQHMNGKMVDFIQQFSKEMPEFYHIHGAGRNFSSMEAELKRRNVHLPPQVRLQEYIYNMPEVMAAADVVLCRGGASTISELTALGRAAIIVPSPNVTNNHQGKNAAILEEAGGALVLPEEEADGARLYEETSHLLREKRKRQEMERAMEGLGIPDASERLYQSLLKLLQKS